MTSCKRCAGKGWYLYDDHHSKPCEVCCRHAQGVWFLDHYYGDDQGKWCCTAGCGQTWDGIVDYNKSQIDAMTLTKHHAENPKETP